MAVANAVDRDRGRQCPQERQRGLVELRLHPFARLAVAVAPDEDGIAVEQPLQAFARERAGDDIAAADDAVDFQRRHLGQHSLERGQVAVNVVENGDAH